MISIAKKDLRLALSILEAQFPKCKIALFVAQYDPDNDKTLIDYGANLATNEDLKWLLDQAKEGLR